MSNLNVYGVIALTLAAVLPPAAAAFMFWHGRKTVRQMNLILMEMHSLSAAIVANRKLYTVLLSVNDKLSKGE